MAGLASKKIKGKELYNSGENLMFYTFWQDKRLRFITITTLACALIYYLPALAGIIGLNDVQASLASLYNFHGIDLYSLFFFLPVIYAAYKFDFIATMLIAFIVFLILIPGVIADGSSALAMFKPAAFIIILSAVGAVVAMLQKSEKQQRQRLREMKCIYDIGKAAEASSNTDVFLDAAANIIAGAMPDPEKASITIQYRDKTSSCSFPAHYPGKLSEDIIVNGEPVGRLTIRGTADNPYVKKQNHLAKTLAERIGGCLREIELSASLQSHYASLEEEVSCRVKEIEDIQARLLRSERLSVLGEMASSVGHELRNPLNVIKNCIYLLRMSCNSITDDEIPELFRTLDNQVDVSSKIVTDLLDYSRIQPPVTSTYPISRIIADATAASSIPGNITVFTVFENPFESVCVDHEQIQRVFSAIISNAVQAMPGGGQLDIVTRSNNNMLTISFTDTGCGIPENNLHRVFEPLFTTRPKGIGLGLPLAKKLVSQNAGSIDITSVKNCGTTVTVCLPLIERNG